MQAAKYFLAKHTPLLGFVPLTSFMNKFKKKDSINKQKKKLPNEWQLLNTYFFEPK